MASGLRVSDRVVETGKEVTTIAQSFAGVGDNLACDKLPVTCRNTEPNPNGLVQDEVYEALPI